MLNVLKFSGFKHTKKFCEKIQANKINKEKTTKATIQFSSKKHVVYVLLYLIYIYIYITTKTKATLKLYKLI